MELLNRLKFWKKEESLEPLGSMGSDFSKPSGFDSLEKKGHEKDAFGADTKTDDLGISRKDMAPGLAGGELPARPGESREGPGHVPESFHEKKGETDVSVVGPSYEKHPDLEPQLKHAPLQSYGQQTGFQEVQQAPVSKDIEIMSAKLDAVKAHVESINHRLESIERILVSEQKRRGVW